MRLLHLAVVFVAAAVCFADTITMKDGRVIQGTYLGGTARQVRVEISGQIQTLDVSDVARIDFVSGAPLEEPAPPPVAQEERRDAPPQPPVLGITLPAGTSFAIRMIDSVDSQTAQVGQSFAASLDAPVVDASGQTIIPRGADVVLKLVDSKQSGKIAGRAELALAMMSVRVNGQLVDIRTQTVRERSADRAGRSAGAIGGGAVGGAVLGGILGGGKGAAIGLGAGAAGGAAVELATSGQRVRVPSETRLTFVLDNPVRI